MTEDRPASAMRNLATLGLAVGGPLTLFSGIGVAMSVLRGIPRALLLVFLLAVGLTVVSLVAYVAADVRERQ